MVLLVQKEVAERIVARDGKQSIPSIAVQAYGHASVVAKVPRGAFNPPPKVDSAILVIRDITRNFFIDCSESLFFTLLKTIFGTKRKQIGGSLGVFLGDKARALSALVSAGISPATRPENITLTQWKALTRVVQNIKNGVQ